MLRAFPRGSSLLELGGGTGDDAVFLAEQGFRILLTDGAPAMLRCANEKIGHAGLEQQIATHCVPLERLDEIVQHPRPGFSEPFDGAYSVFAALNCVPDLTALARPLAALLRPGAACLLVMFGPCSPGEILIQLLRGDLSAAFRRLRRGPVPARLAGQDFTVWYPRPSEVAHAWQPYFRLRRVRGIGILVPPSAAEPWISGFPRFLNLLEVADRMLAAPLALLGDHVLLHFERTGQVAG